MVGVSVPDFHHGYCSGSDVLARAASQTYGVLPLAFEANQGQTDPRVKFLARGSGCDLFLTATEAALSVLVPQTRADKMSSSTNVVPSAGAVVIVRLVNANAAAEVSGATRLPGRSHYLIGSDPHRWVTNVPTYNGVRYRDIYPGVDLVYYSDQGRLKYDFVIAPGSRPSCIVLGFEGVDSLTVTANGDLVAETPAGKICQRKPFVYQDIGRRRYEVDGRYVCTGGRQVHFEVGHFDPDRTLIIDPVLVYSTYLGPGAGDGIAVDRDGCAYITGRATAPTFPTTPGAFQTTHSKSGNTAFVTKLNHNGSALVYSTYLGGATEKEAFGSGIAVDEGGHVYVTGMTDSDSFPITSGAFQPTDPSPDTLTAFVTKLNCDGSGLIYSTYLGGTSRDSGIGIAVDSEGHAYVTGRADSTDFPTTPGAFQSTDPQPDGPDDVFVTKFNRDGSALIYSTYLGGAGAENPFGIAVDEAGHAYVTGPTSSQNFPTTPGAFQPTNPDPGSNDTAFVTKLNRDGSGLVYSTYLGGTDFDTGNDIKVDREGNAYITGSTGSGDFPTTPGAFQPNNPGGNSNAFVTKLNRDGSALIYSTYLGGTSGALSSGLAVDRNGNAYVTGGTFSEDFPTTSDALQPTDPDKGVSGFLAKLSGDGSMLLYSTYLGGRFTNGNAITVDRNGDIYVTGETSSNDFPTTPDALEPTHPSPGTHCSFVVKFGDGSH